MGKQLELIFEKEGDFKIDFSKLFSIMPSKNLAEEFLAYKKEEMDSPEYLALVDEISIRKNDKDSIKKWAVKYNLTKTKEKDLEFYKVLNERNLDPFDGDPFYLKNAVREVYGYKSLNGKSSTAVTVNGEIIKVNSRISLKELEPEKIRSFSKVRYSNGREISDRLKKG